LKVGLKGTHFLRRKDKMAGKKKQSIRSSVGNGRMAKKTKGEYKTKVKNEEMDIMDKKKQDEGVAQKTGAASKKKGIFVCLKTNGCMY
jgi:hypothetical protein